MHLWLVGCSFQGRHRVTMSRNRLGLSLLKHIRHELIVKINGKRRSQICEALDQISTDHSRTRYTPVPIASPRPTRRASARVSLFLLSSTLLQMYREQVIF
jgi:hypothetical protein